MQCKGLHTQGSRGGGKAQAEAKAAAGEAAKSKRSRTQSSPGTSIPDFSASTMISPDKIKTLGISV